MNSEEEKLIVDSINAHFVAVSKATGWPAMRTDCSRRDCEMAVGANLILTLCTELNLDVKVPE